MEPRMRMAHLLRRAGFGPAPGEIEARLNDDFEQTVRLLLEPGGVSDGLGEIDRQIGGLLDFNNIEDVRSWWIHRMIHSQRPLIVSAFLDDLKAHGLEERVAVLTYSEFGRRAQENASAGTDHGAASSLFVVGSMAWPSPDSHRGGTPRLP